MSRNLEQIYTTKCGMHLKEEVFVVSVCDSLYYMNKHYTSFYSGQMEKCRDCTTFIFKSGNLVFCELDKTNATYDYENSVNKLIKEYDKNFHKKYKEITKGSYCPNVIQTYENAVKRYDLRECIKANCENKICAITGKKRTEENLSKVNLFYDLKHIEQRGFLVFEDWEKNLKYFETRIARDLAEKQMKLIEKNEPEKLNLRVETRKTKSLFEDLEKIRFAR